MSGHPGASNRHRRVAVHLGEVGGAQVRVTLGFAGVDAGDGNRDVRGAPSVQSDTVGTGAVTIHRDGRKIVGRWERTKASAPLRFREKSGDAIALKPGQTWVVLAG